ncbi:hypothetical protein BEL04_06535 [Mucilaginibacter sp. PPCGB 2223]|uniref:hypothetical protein n=1 Tax=Mucilaginibacter sp. PPCGB 2223 TaxID=1886027 RepID=UPI000826D136|nr:hypothetical protein [Mucilaginibacter sp. PPCGB 2223]OCX53932.1 hypothetical protein BEL04_06535 [Mucilaginibacter sp. PPCGB 2223]
MKVIKALQRRGKHILWFLFPALVWRYYNARWRSFKNIVIVPHGGLGDIGVIVPALKKLAGKFDNIYVVCHPEYFKAAQILFALPANIHHIDFPAQHRKVYELDTEFSSTLKEYGQLIKLGTYDNDPIVNYPDLFFLKLGIDPACVNDKYEIDYNKLSNPQLDSFIRQIGNQYVYVNLTTSEELMAFNSKYPDNIPYISYGDSALALGIKTYSDINDIKPLSIHTSIINNVLTCLRASHVIISDAGLFNLVIKFVNCPALTVVTRAHNHSHNRSLYKSIKFNGTIQSCSFN